MEGLISPEDTNNLREFIDISKKDEKAELECKLLSKKIVTKDVADRLLETVKTLSIGAPTEENRMILSYPDNIRVNVVSPQLIHKVCVQGSFKDVPVLVERKQPYFEKGSSKKDVIDIRDFDSKFSLRTESQIRKDWDGTPNDPKAHLRIMNRKSFKTSNQLFRIDFSLVKTRFANSKQLVGDTLKQEGEYELEIEFINKKTELSSALIAKEYFKVLTALLQSFNQSPFLLSNSDVQRYAQEFKMTPNQFWNPVTLEKRHLSLENPHNISKDYTVTVKADGERFGLYVARDRKVLRVANRTFIVTWTGITANNDNHVGDFLDGEFIASKNLFCIFDIYRYKNKDVRNLPLLTNDEDLVKNPSKCRLGCAKLFVEDLNKEFTMSPSAIPLRVETKLFLAGDGVAMEEAIENLLTAEYEYETDGLIFTPRTSSVAPPEDRKGNRWNRVYKWKPSSHNSIDFLVKFDPKETIDPKTGDRSRKGSLYVGLTPNDYIVYPRETITGEYVPKKVEDDPKTRVPAIFQPAKPHDPDAYHIYIPLDGRNKPTDLNDDEVKDNTIVECTFDLEKYRWNVMRTRYDKTYRYKVLKQPEYGNDYAAADNIWSSIHAPITEEVLKKFVSNPPPISYEDDTYYDDESKKLSRAFTEIRRKFHTHIKYDLYIKCVKQDNVLLELATGRDIKKWLTVKPSKVVALDISLSTIIAPKQGATTRYLEEKRDNPGGFLPPVLFIEGDMTHYPLFEQEDKYMPILTGEKTAPTEYLAKFEGLTKFDSISCQFAMHYACESEETFRNFAKNIDKYGKSLFFGTCSDGASIYSLLLSKKSHLFKMDNKIVGEYIKQYDDQQTWTDEQFGMPVNVMLETFNSPITEWLTPWKKVVEIMSEEGWELLESKLFSELYAEQTGITLTQEQQTFSFLNRTFIFKKGKKREVKKEEPKEESKEETKVEEEEKPKKRKLRKETTEEEPILFDGADASKGPHRNFSNDSEHPIEIDGEKFPTVEHYFQAMKAKEFDDQEVYKKIVSSKTPKAAKAAGKKVKNFATEVWDSKREAVMEKGVRAKFVQHPELRKELLETGDKIIGKADARNTFWGIGTGMSSEKAKVPSKWRGQNKLGKLLMELRQTLKDQTD
jgi:ribA/ribD-fused uncharacterized protein